MRSSSSCLSRAAAASALIGLTSLGCGEGTGAATDTEGKGGDAEAYDWGLPRGYPIPPVPANNPMSTVKVELGRRLFYDARLSGNETSSCASCHRQELAFTDGLARAVGSTGERTPRSAMSLVNVAYLTGLTWANPTLRSLEEQALIPMFGEAPVELGLAGMEEALLDRLKAEPIYRDLFPKAFPGESEPVSIDNVARAIAAFERTLLSYRSPHDRYVLQGDRSGMSEAALRGRALFFSERLRCFLCHGGFNLSNSVVRAGEEEKAPKFDNTGLYNLGGTGAYPEENTGLFAITGEPEDMGRFRSPTLRNIAVTAPFMHDGSVETLDGALDHYAAGGREIASGPYAGDGRKNPYKSTFIDGFEISEAEKADVIAFLESVTDQELLRDPRFADPWKEEP